MRYSQAMDDQVKISDVLHRDLTLDYNRALKAASPNESCRRIPNIYIMANPEHDTMFTQLINASVPEIRVTVAWDAVEQLRMHGESISNEVMSVCHIQPISPSSSESSTVSGGSRSGFTKTLRRGSSTLALVCKSAYGKIVHRSATTA